MRLEGMRPSQDIYSRHLLGASGTAGFATNQPLSTTEVRDRSRDRRTDGRSDRQRTDPDRWLFIDFTYF